MTSSIIREHEPTPEDSDQPNKRRRLRRGTHGTQAADMSLITPENASDRNGWKVMPSGRILRPVRMRPSHPLPTPEDALRSKVTSKKDADKKKRKRVKDAPVRARRRTIDMTRWGSTQLKGIFLENVVSNPAAFNRHDSAEPNLTISENEEEDGDEILVEHALVDQSSFGHGNIEKAIDIVIPTPEAAVENRTPLPNIRDPSKKTSVIPPDTEALRRDTIPEAANATITDLHEETHQTLTFLAQLFGEAEATGKDWGGSESVDEDEEVRKRPPSSMPMHLDQSAVEEVPADPRGVFGRMTFSNHDDEQEQEEDQEEEQEEEEVPNGGGANEDEDKENDEEDEGQEDGDEDEDDASDEEDAMDVVSEPAPEASTSKHTSSQAASATKLKDLFAPREEEGQRHRLSCRISYANTLVSFIVGFSLLGHLDLDLELDDELDFGLVAPTIGMAVPEDTETSVLPSDSVPLVPTTVSRPQTMWTFNALEPLFFPRPSGAKKGRAKDPIEIAKERGTNWRDGKFYRTESEAEIRKQWDENKLDLTREWKRRHREAVKSRRRRGGVDGE
jgi:hypothetical protein